MTAISSPIREAHAPGRAGAFAAAQRHSRVVRALRMLVPATGVVAVLAVMGGWFLSSFNVPDLEIGDVTITDEGIAMDAPVLRGEDREGRPYELRAREAFQTVSSQPVVIMRNLEGELALDDEDQVSIVAPQARFDSKTSLINFEEGGVVLTLASGGSAQLGVAQVDLQNGTMISNEAVAIANAEVTLNAGAMQGFEGGQRLLFTGGVTMVFTPQNDDQPGSGEPVIGQQSEAQ